MPSLYINVVESRSVSWERKTMSSLYPVCRWSAFDWYCYYCYCVLINDAAVWCVCTQLLSEDLLLVIRDVAGSWLRKIRVNTNHQQFMYNLCLSFMVSYRCRC